MLPSPAEPVIRTLPDDVGNRMDGVSDVPGPVDGICLGEREDGCKPPPLQTAVLLVDDLCPDQEPGGFPAVQTTL